METDGRVGNDEDRYIHIDLIVKERPGEESWFDTIYELMTQNCDCDSVELEDGEWSPCSCGMEHMGGSSGTLQQCYDHSTNVGQGLKLIDLARAIDTFNTMLNGTTVDEETVVLANKALNWARDEIHFEEHWNDPIEDEDDE